MRHTGTMTRADIEAVVAPMLQPHSSELRELALSAATRLAEILDPADLLVYDNYNAVALGWSFTGRTSDVVVSLPVYSQKVVLGFMWGVVLDDPEKRLRGSGNQYRSIPLPSLSVLDDPYVLGLIEQAASRGRGDCDGRVVFKSESAKKVRPQPAPDTEPLR